MAEQSSVKPEPDWLDEYEEEDVCQDELPDPQQFLQVDIKLESEHITAKVDEENFQDSDDEECGETDEEPLPVSCPDDGGSNAAISPIDSNGIEDNGNNNFRKNGTPRKLVAWCDRQFSCSLCDRRFSQNSGLKSHMLTHTGEKPFSCPQCHRQFSHRTHVKRHMLTHTGLRPHSCSLCSRKFSLRSNLVKHMKTHSGEKPFECDLCQRSFAQKFNLNTHMFIHIRKKAFPCSICHRQYSHRSSLVKHSLSKHSLSHKVAKS